MMRGVRRLVLLVMIVLLPMRMWAAELMTLNMAEAELAPAVAAMPADCPMMAKVGAAATDAGHDHAQPTGKPCLACPLCAAVAGCAATVAEADPAPPPLSGTVASRYASAEAPPEHRPPISC